MRRIIAASLLLMAMTVSAKANAPVRGYLDESGLPDLTLVLPAPPEPGSPRAEADRAIFEQSRSLKDTPRWALATADVTGSSFDHFACALGVRLTPQQAPALNDLLDRAGRDRSVVVDAKRHYQTERPWVGNDLPICEPRTEHLAGNGDYPSGHAAHGQHVAMILAAIAPDRSTQLLARGRAFGESRWVCGSHSQSAAEAGTMAGSVIFAAELNAPDFRADLERTRTELAALRAAATGTPEGCPAS